MTPPAGLLGLHVTDTLLCFLLVSLFMSCFGQNHLPGDLEAWLQCQQLLDLLVLKTSSLRTLSRVGYLSLSRALVDGISVAK